MIKIETYSPLIARYDEVIPDDLCDAVVSYMMQEKPDQPLKGGLPWDQHDNISFVAIKDKKLRGRLDTYRFLFTQLVNNHYNTIVYPHFSDMVVWRKGMSMGFHKDDGYEGESQDIFRNRKYSMVAYLNDDYLGGETVIKLENSEYVSSPKKGSIVVFKANDECIHGVNEVKKGTRYTMATWFATDIKDCEYVDRF